MQIDNLGIAENLIRQITDVIDGQASWLRNHILSGRSFLYGYSYEELIQNIRQDIRQTTGFDLSDKKASSILNKKLVDLNSHIMNGSKILIPRLRVSEKGWLESAKLLDILVLLYDKVYWDTPPNPLLYPEALAKMTKLAPYGVDGRFPDRFIEYMKQGIIIPFTEGEGYYSAPVESKQEKEIAQYLLYTDLNVLVWNEYPDLNISFASVFSTVCRELGIPLIIEPDHPSHSFASMASLFMNVVFSKALDIGNIFIGDQSEEAEWKTLSRLFGEEGMKQTWPPTGLDTPSLVRLFEGLILCSPSHLSVDEVLRLREEVPTAKLRSWIGQQVSKAKQRIFLTDPVTYLLEDFNNLVREATYKNKEGIIFKISLGALAATLGAVLGGIPGAAVGGALGGLAGTAAEKASLTWRSRYGRLNWVLNIYRFRNKRKRG